MKFLLSLALVLAAAGSARAQRATPPPSSQGRALFDLLWGQPQTPHPSVVRVIVPQRDGVSLGSGTLVDSNEQHGLVVTNWHVVDNPGGPITVAFPDGFRTTGQVLKVDRDWDLAALLIHKPPTARPVPLADRAPQPGDRLTIAGYGPGPYRAATGECTQYVAPGANFPYEMVEVAASARQGDSGGPIFNDRGQLAGVLFGEGHGRTSGSYCGRVHQFLMLASAEMHAAPPLASASGPPESRITAMPPAAPDTSPPGGTSPVASEADVPSRYEFASHEAETWRPTRVPDMPENAEAPRPPISPAWREFTGSTPVEQVKAALAVVGLLALVARSLRLVH